MIQENVGGGGNFRIEDFSQSIKPKDKIIDFVLTKYLQGLNTIIPNEYILIVHYS